MQSLNTEEIVTNFKSSGINIIPVDAQTTRNTFYFKGNLTDFINAAKTLNENIAFMQEFLLDDSDFFYQLKAKVFGEYGQSIVDDSSSQEIEIDLTQFLPELSEYKSYVGKPSFLICQIFFKNQSLSYIHSAEWYESFSEAIENAKDIFLKKEANLKIQYEQQEAAVRLEIEKNENKLLQLLETLVDDPKFIALGTQKAKQEYCLTLYPELTELPSSRLKDEISNINAKIQAKKALS